MHVLAHLGFSLIVSVSVSGVNIISVTLITLIKRFYLTSSLLVYLLLLICLVVVLIMVHL